MKKVLLIALLASVTIVPMAAEESRPANGVALDPIWLIFNTYKGSYERLIFDQFSLQAEIAYSPDFFWGMHDYNRITLLDIIGEARYYYGHFLKDAASQVDFRNFNTHFARLFTDALGGLYVGGFVGYVNSVVEDGENSTYYKGTLNGVGGGLELGAKYVFGEDRFSFFIEPYALWQLYAGGYHYTDSQGNSIDKPQSFKEDGFNRTGLSAGLNFGILF